RSPVTIAMNAEQLRIYREVLATFADRERVLLTLRLEEGVEFAQLAATLAYPSADAARKAFHTVQARLLLRLRQSGLDPGQEREGPWRRIATSRTPMTMPGSRRGSSRRSRRSTGAPTSTCGRCAPTARICCHRWRRRSACAMRCRRCTGASRR